ncbi:hypothetical protein [Brevibacillus reuszeri]|nr:hypothetical protein [Brevibacillus reuszeri]
MSIKQQLLRKKSIVQLLEQVEDKQGALKKTLSAFDLTMRGVGQCLSFVP